MVPGKVNYVFRKTQKETEKCNNFLNFFYLKHHLWNNMVKQIFVILVITHGFSSTGYVIINKNTVYH